MGKDLEESLAWQEPFVVDAFGESRVPAERCALPFTVHVFT